MVLVTNMLAEAVFYYFRHKAVASIIIISCWSPAAQVSFIRQMSRLGLSATFSCDTSALDHISRQHLQGVLYFTHGNDNEKTFSEVEQNHFMHKYKWLIVGDQVPEQLEKARYDADIAFLQQLSSKNTDNNKVLSKASSNSFIFYDVYVHPREGISIHLWARWSLIFGFTLTHDRERILRRQDLKRYQIKVATPIPLRYRIGKEKVGDTSAYQGTLKSFLNDEAMKNNDPGIHAGYQTSTLITRKINAQDVLVEAESYFDTSNNSMYTMVTTGEADITGAILRVLIKRIYVMDFILGIWPFRVGFTYLAERESSSNMFLEPFTYGVWWTCLGIMVILALVQRFTSKSAMEKDGAFYTVLTTFLQQDASAVPAGPSGRWAFIVQSVTAMLVHAYYTSAIVSALMSTGMGGPDSLRALADSKYAVTSEDFDYLRLLFFDVKTTWDDLEYLKKKKKSSKFYQKMERGVDLIEQGNTAFHAEYNQIYPHFKRFSDENICKIQHIDTIPQTLTWITASKDSQWTNVFHVAGAWVLETGIGRRIINRLRIPQPPCRAALLAERVKIGDIAPLLILSVVGAFLSLIILGIEIMIPNIKQKKYKLTNRSKPPLLDDTLEVSNTIAYDNFIH